MNSYCRVGSVDNYLDFYLFYIKMYKAYFLQTFAWICWTIFVNNGMHLSDCTIPQSVCVFMFLIGVTVTLASLCCLVGSLDEPSEKCGKKGKKRSKKCGKND